MKKVTRAVKRQYGPTARRVAVRTHVAWYWRGLFMALALTFGIGVAWWMYDIGSLFAGFDRKATEHELVELRSRLKQLESENGVLRAAQITNSSHNQIDSAAQQDTERALKVLQDENAQLREKLAFFRGMDSSDHTGGLNISRFKVERGAAGVYRYQLLLVLTGQKDKVFHGRLQLVVTTKGAGKNNILTFPANGVEKEKFIISVKSYQRLEGDFQLPVASEVMGVEARIFGEGSAQPKLTKTVNLS